MKQNVLITGANRGIGLALVREYLGRGDQVFAACRHPGEVLPLTGAVVIDGVDVTNPDSLEGLAHRLEGHKVDLLINNAGILISDRLENLKFDAILKQFEVNSLGPLRVTAALLPVFAKKAKIGLMTSRMGSIADNTSGGYYGYRMSKAALNAAGVSLARDLKKNGIAVAILHPGFVQTDMVRGGGNVTPETAAKQLASVLDHLNLETTGTFWHANGECLPW
jgi:NAD(P)-dependent dehydrogenase (short-subunit alcohol dehydrogenase family)